VIKKFKMGKFDKDERREVFANLDKTTVFQDAKAFNESPLNPRKCRVILAKICLLLSRNINVAPQEATELFFSITKLFQCHDVKNSNLRSLCAKSYT
jgi:coatomer protein complex subunit gamma